jgi:hypothetical protein
MMPGERMIIDNDEEEMRCKALQGLVREDILGETETIIGRLRFVFSQESNSQINRGLLYQQTLERQ